MIKTISRTDPDQFDRAVANFLSDIPEGNIVDEYYYSSSVAFLQPSKSIAIPGAGAGNHLQIITVYTATIQFIPIPDKNLNGQEQQ